MSLILASNSQIRSAMLTQAGLPFAVRSPNFDEEAVKADGLSGEILVRRLAEGKATSVVASKDDWVIGSDSSATVDGVRYSKPRCREEAAEHLRHFSGRTMFLSSAVAIARGGRADWSHAETASVTFRELSSEYIAHYLACEWPDVGYCVGVFRMEGLGVTLFDRVEGNHFTILGMPLLPLLAALRDREVMPS